MNTTSPTLQKMRLLPIVVLGTLCAAALAACARPTASPTSSPSPTSTATATPTASATPTPTATPTATPTPLPKYAVNLRPIEIKGAQTAWTERALPGYQIHLAAGPPFYFYILTVIQEKVTQAHRSREPLDGALKNLPDALAEVRMAPLYNLRGLLDYTVTGLFDRVMSYYQTRPSIPPCDTQITVELNDKWAFPQRIAERWAADCSAEAAPAWVDVVAFITLTPAPTSTASPTATSTPTNTPPPTPTNTPTPSSTPTPTRDPNVAIERSPAGEGWNQLQHTVVGYTLHLPETWRDYDPDVEEALARGKTRAISPCFDALLSSLLDQDIGVEFSLLAFDESLSTPDQTKLPASIAVGHAEAPAPLPISLLAVEFTRRMNAIPEVTVVETGSRPKINGMSAAQLTSRIEGLCDINGQSVPTTGVQIYLADGTTIHIITLIAPDAIYSAYQARFDAIAESFRRTE